MLNVFLLILGLVLIIVGGNIFVDASVGIAEKLHIPKFIIGATVVSLATTLPELIVSVIATIGGKYEMAAGNAIGSVVANTGFILAIALIASPSENRTPKAILLIIAELITIVISLTGGNVFSTLPLLLTSIVFMAISLKDGIKNEDESDRTQKGLILTILRFVLGVAGLIIGSRLLVSKGSALAVSLGVPEGVIAVTIVAMGTSLPELVTAITAIVKKQASLSLGNILGANIMDIAFIMPICAIVGGGLVIPRQTLILDLPFCILLTLVAFLPKKKSRFVGVALFTIYVAYLIMLISFFV